MEAVLRLKVANQVAALLVKVVAARVVRVLNQAAHRVNLLLQVQAALLVAKAHRARLVV